MNGFTLLEIMLALAFITLMAALPFFWTRFSLSSNDLRLTEQTIVHALRQAQLFARAEKRDASWGAFVSSSSVVIFQGDSYATRTEGSDRVMSFPTPVIASGLNEVVYEKFTGEPNVTDTITVESGASSHTITIHTHGFLDYSYE